jgi:hypothetical protein
MKMKTPVLILVAVLAATLLLKVLTAAFVAVVHLVWQPQHWWQWSLLCGALSAAAGLVVGRSAAAALFLGAFGLLCGASLGITVDSGMDFVDVFLWPLGG